MQIDVRAQEQAFMPMGCKCRAWCGIAGASVNGTWTVVAGGGALGFGPGVQPPDLTVNGPGGYHQNFPSGSFSREKILSINSAQPGAWYVVASSQDGQKTTSSVTFP